MPDDLAPQPPAITSPIHRLARLALARNARMVVAGMLLIAALPVGIWVATLHAHSAPRTVIVPVNGASQATITFTRQTMPASAPDSTLLAAQSGGKILTTEITVTVRQVTSAPIAATAQSGAYVVPAHCGDAGPAYHAALAGLQAKLSSLTPGGTISYYGPGYGVNPGSLTCQPAAGTTQPQPFYYTQQIDGSAVQDVFRLSDAQLYQIDQMTRTLPPHYVLTATSTCNDVPTMTGRTRYSVTIVCPTTGVAAWDWSAGDLATLAKQLVGLNPAQVSLLLDHTPGIVPGSAHVALQGGSTLPLKSAQLTLVVNG